MTEQSPPKTSNEIAQVTYDTKDTPYRGYSVRASYLKPPRDRDALIQISRNGVVIKTTLYPAYRIYNIAAHFTEIVDGLIEEAENPSAHVAAGVSIYD